MKSRSRSRGETSSRGSRPTSAKTVIARGFPRCARGFASPSKTRRARQRGRTLDAITALGAGRIDDAVKLAAPIAATRIAARDLFMARFRPEMRFDLGDLVRDQVTAAVYTPRSLETLMKCRYSFLTGAILGLRPLHLARAPSVSAQDRGRVTRAALRSLDAVARGGRAPTESDAKTALQKAIESEIPWADRGDMRLSLDDLRRTVEAFLKRYLELRSAWRLDFANDAPPRDDVKPVALALPSKRFPMVNLSPVSPRIETIVAHAGGEDARAIIMDLKLGTTQSMLKLRDAGLDLDAALIPRVLAAQKEGRDVAAFVRLSLSKPEGEALTRAGEDKGFEGTATTTLVTVDRMRPLEGFTEATLQRVGDALEALLDDEAEYAPHDAVRRAELESAGARSCELLRDAPRVPLQDGRRCGVSARVNPPRLVSAGAGSGKTWRIVQSIVERVRSGVSIDRIAAVTFTEAAAAELQDRVRAGLLTHGLDDQAARVDVAVICTIHRFALTLLQRYPLAAGLPPEPIVLDEDQAATLRRGASSPTSSTTTTTRPRCAHARRVPRPGRGARGAGWGDGDTPAGRLQSLVREVLEKGRSIAMTPERLEREGSIASQRLLDAMGPAGNESILDRDMAEGLKLAYAWIDKNPEPKRKGDFGFYEALRALRSERGLAPFDVALRVAACEVTKTTEKDVAALLTAARASAKNHPALRQRLADGVRRVFSLSARVLARYREEKARMGAVDFEDMQLIALELIAGRASGREAYAELIAKALPYIVVDEFQDTSPLQFRLFEALREAGAEVRYVGDLKQGIYGFRSADSTLFAALLTRAEAEGDKAESLDRSRRSRPELVEFANALFGALMPPSGLPFTPLTAENRYSQGACPKTTRPRSTW